MLYIRIPWNESHQISYPVGRCDWDREHWVGNAKKSPDSGELPGQRLWCEQIKRLFKWTLDWQITAPLLAVAALYSSPLLPPLSLHWLPLNEREREATKKSRLFVCNSSCNCYDGHRTISISHAFCCRRRLTISFHRNIPIKLRTSDGRLMASNVIVFADGN